MTNNNKIWHKGIIRTISKDKVEVSIVTHSACSGCHAKGMCGVSDIKEKIVEAVLPDFEIKKGDKVVVFASSGNAVFSVIMAYIIPILIIILSVYLSVSLGLSEELSAFIGILAVALYYLILSLFKNKIGSKIRFTIEKS